jgi:hypothetical protein
VRRIFEYYDDGTGIKKCFLCDIYMGEAPHPLLPKAKFIINQLLSIIYKLTKFEASFLYEVREKKLSDLSWEDVQKLKVIGNGYFKENFTIEKKVKITDW